MLACPVLLLLPLLQMPQCSCTACASGMEWEGASSSLFVLQAVFAQGLIGFLVACSLLKLIGMLMFVLQDVRLQLWLLHPWHLLSC